MHHLFVEHSQAVTCVKFATSEKNLLAFSSLDGTVSVCSGLVQPRLLRKLEGHAAAITGTFEIPNG
jgi:WD40 repeat protein